MKGQAACTDDVRVRGSFQDDVQQLRAAALRVAWLDVARSSQSRSWKLEALGLQNSSHGACRFSLGEGWCWEVRISFPPSAWKGICACRGVSSLLFSWEINRIQLWSYSMSFLPEMSFFFFFSAVPLPLTLQLISYVKIIVYKLCLWLTFAYTS